jgi:hypothetical protein
MVGLYTPDGREMEDQSHGLPQFPVFSDHDGLARAIAKLLYAERTQSPSLHLRNKPRVEEIAAYCFSA